MGDISINELISAIDKYFANITDEQLRHDCEKASIDFYNKIDAIIFSHTHGYGVNPPDKFKEDIGKTPVDIQKVKDK